MLSISTGAEKYTLLLDISHIILPRIVSEKSPITEITLRPLLSILKKMNSAYSAVKAVIHKSLYRY